MMISICIGSKYQLSSRVSLWCRSRISRSNDLLNTLLPLAHSVFCDPDLIFYPIPIIQQPTSKPLSLMNYVLRTWSILQLHNGQPLLIWYFKSSLHMYIMAILTWFYARTFWIWICLVCIGPLPPSSSLHHLLNCSWQNVINNKND